jgi:hypothetical protein
MIDIEEAVIKAGFSGNEETLNRLLKHPSANPSARNNQAIINAIECEQNHILPLLYNHPRFDPLSGNYELMLREVTAELIVLMKKI